MPRVAQGFVPMPDQANIFGQATARDLKGERPDLRTLQIPAPMDEMDAEHIGKCDGDRAFLLNHALSQLVHEQLLAREEPR